MDSLEALADLIASRNRVEREITKIIGRPALIGHIGEYIASQIFHIALETSASRKSIDGIFTDGELRGRSVNIKWYAKAEGLLDITPDSLPDYYLVLAGTRSATLSSRGESRPWLIKAVFCLDARALDEQLRSRDLLIGIACSVARRFWDQAEVYPKQSNVALTLSERQRAQLALFAGDNLGA